MYTIKLEQFSGPFDVLLTLIEKEKLDITEISLVKVTNEFIKYVHALNEVSAHELANFLEIVSKLILLKSRLLIPSAFLDDEEEDDLVDRLKLYREFSRASKDVATLISQPFYSFAKEKIPLDRKTFVLFESKVDPILLEKSFKSIILTIAESITLSQKTIKKKVISLKEKINELLVLIKRHKKIIFNPLLLGKKKAEQAVLFLAVLELMKQKRIHVSQKELFGDILIKSNT